ncbi:putative FAD-binding oxidase [Escherichia coli]|nr:putative FAD-binding oxidase [Escherichia coli]
MLLPFSPNGKAQHIKGFLNRFAKTAKKTADFLNRMAKLGMPMVGVDPALVLCYRDEYKLALGEERGEFNVLLANEWLASALESQPVATVSGESWYFFGHCTEVTALPARQHNGPRYLPVLARNWKMSAWLLRHGRDLRT